MMRVGLTVLIAFAACGDTSSAESDAAFRLDATQRTDATIRSADGAPIDAPVDANIADAPPVGGHLLLTEIVASPLLLSFIEIYNPTTQTIGLEHYYLSDSNRYPYVPGVFGAGPALQDEIFDLSDFVIKFPEGATIGPGEVIIVAADNGSFEHEYAKEPDFAFLDLSIDHPDGGTSSTVPMVSIARGLLPQLTPDGEFVALFYWDSESDLIKDVDIMNFGTPLLTQAAPCKTNWPVDGPDADENHSLYPLEEPLLTLQGTAHAEGQSTKRLLPEMGHERSGGSGLTGDDETSENIAATWDGPGTYTAPTPGEVPASLVP